MRVDFFLRAVVCVGSVALSAACGAAGPPGLELPVRARGVGAEPFRVGEWEVQLGRAQVGFGPLYLCATAAASSDLCPTAVAELAASVTVDALNPSAQEVGTLEGFAGTVQSATYDFAYSWFSTWRSPRPLEGAPERHSAVLEGTAQRGSERVPFHLEVDVLPQFQGTRAVQGQRTEAVLAAGLQLEVRFDPRAWLSQVDFGAVAAGAAGGPAALSPQSQAAQVAAAAMGSTGAPSLQWTPQ